MKNIIIIFIAMSVFYSCKSPAGKKTEYPVSKKGDVTDNYFGTTVPDPYRWMEDERVVPAHSFKFAANLQEKQAGKNPVLIRIETKAGHGAGTPVSKTIEQYADIFGFTLWNMGIKELM